MTSSSTTAWYKVLTGARLVATAVVKQSAHDVAGHAQRVAHHGSDLSAKATSTMASSSTSAAFWKRDQDLLTSMRMSPVITEVVTVMAQQLLASQQQRQQEQKQHSPSSKPSHGTAPYESQLRKRQQRQAQTQQAVEEKIAKGENLSPASESSFVSSSPSSSSDPTSKTMEAPQINPFLVHATVPSSPSSWRTTARDEMSINNVNAIRSNINSNTNSSHSITRDSDNSASTPLDTTTAAAEAVTATGSSERNNGTEERMPSSSSSSPSIPSASEISSSSTTPPPRLAEGRAVPSTRVGRAFGFAGLGAGLAWGAMGEMASRLVGGGGGGNNVANGSRNGGRGSVLTTDANADRLAATLCRMRGAALKMGQMLSIQDETLLPPALTRALNQVRQGADAMPSWQLEKQMKQQLGPHWRDLFVTFEDRPFAAASIGQVHRAQIKNENDKDDGKLRDVVVKVQFPGVADSIESDLGNLAMLVNMTGLSPKGLFIENVIRVGRDELKVECNYLNELANQETFQTLVHADPVLRSNKFTVPDVVEDLTTEQVLTTAYAPGGTIDKVAELTDQEERNRIGRTILYLTIQELFEWRLMQTDPNWGNFLYDETTQITTLIDFGATREYPKSFVDGYLRIVWASACQDEETLMAQSRKMNFLTGEENDIMLNAHKLSGFTVGEPFWKDEPFDFRGSEISSRLSEHTSVFLRHRLTPPPEEVYTLHRKLAGAYMLCIKLGAVVRCRDMLEAIVANHDFEDGLPNPITGK